MLTRWFQRARQQAVEDDMALDTHSSTSTLFSRDSIDFDDSSAQDLRRTVLPFSKMVADEGKDDPQRLYRYKLDHTCADPVSKEVRQKLLVGVHLLYIYLDIN